MHPDPTYLPIALLLPFVLVTSPNPKQNKIKKKTHNLSPPKTKQNHNNKKENPTNQTKKILAWSL